MIIIQDDGGVVARGTRIVLGADMTLTEDATGLPVINAVLAGGSVSGSGTTGTIPKWSSSSALTDSIITESGGAISVAGGLTASGDVLIGTTTAATAVPRLDVVGTIALVLSDIVTNSTEKLLRFGLRHYTNAEEPVALLTGRSNASASIIAMGGGITALFNAATELQFYTAANTTTVTGTLRLSISSTGAANFQSNAVSMGALTAASGAFTTPLPTSETAAKVVSVVGGVGIDATAGENPSLSLDVGELTIGPVPLEGTDYIVALNSTLTRRQLISSIPLSSFNDDITGGFGDITRVNITAGTGLTGSVNTASGDHVQTITPDFNALALPAGSLIISDHFVVVDGTATRKERIDQIEVGLFANAEGYTTNTGDITRVNITAGDGLSGDVNTASGDHVQTINVDTTVIRTTGAQTIGGLKTFTSILRGPVGSAAAPAFSFPSPENDCGMYRSATNQVSFSTNGLELLRLNGARRVQLHDGGVVTNVAGVVVSTSAPVSQDNVEGTIWCEV